MVLPHVAQNPDGADHLAVRVAQRGGVEGRGDHLAARAPGVEARVAGDAPRHDLAQRRRELACLLGADRSEEHTSELQSQSNLVCRLLLEKKKKKPIET